MEIKVCSKCGREFPATREYFPADKRKKDGLRYQCKECCAKAWRSYYETHKEDLKEKHRAAYSGEHFQRDRARNVARSRARREADPKKYREYQKAYREQNRARISAQKKAYREANSAKVKARKKAYYEANKDVILAKMKVWVEDNRKRAYANGRAWRKRNPLHGREQRQRRQALKRGATVTLFTVAEWLAAQPRPLRCYLCGKLIRDRKYDIDHRIPLTRGGPHAPWNLGITCPFCNRSKGGRTPWEFLPDKFAPGLHL